jgi:hypothetical protein
MKTAFILIVLAAGACAHTPQQRTETAAIITKSTADGLGLGYLEYCKEVRMPACVEAARKASESGAPTTQEERVACLRPCDSATADRIKAAVDILRTAQTAVWLLLTRGDATAAELEAAREQLLRSAQKLLALLEETGATRALKDAVGDP